MPLLKTYELIVDVETSVSSSPAFSVSQGDLNTVRLNIALTQDAKPVDLTGREVRLAIKKPSGMIVYQDATIESPKDGKAYVMLSTEGYTELGNHVGELYIYEESRTKVAVTATFSYNSRMALMNDGTLESNNDFQAINDTLQNLSGVESGSGGTINAYTKTEADGKFALIGSSYTKSEADTKFALKGQGGGGGTWGSIIGTLADQTDLQNALDNKAFASHTHLIADINLLQDTLDDKAGLVHGHAIGDVTNLQSTLDDKIGQAELDSALAGKLSSSYGTMTGSLVVKQTGSGSASLSLQNATDDTRLRFASALGNNYIQSANDANNASKKLLLTGHLGNKAPEIQLYAELTKVGQDLEVLGQANVKDVVATGKVSASTLQRGGEDAIVSEGNKVMKIWTGTQAQYDAIATKSSTTLYFVNG